MPVITETVESDLHVEATFDYVANFENIVEWDPGVTAVRKVTDGDPAVGTEYDLDLQYGGSPLTMTYRITEWDPPRRVVLERAGDPRHRDRGCLLRRPARPHDPRGEGGPAAQSLGGQGGNSR